MKLPNKHFYDYTEIEATLTDSGLPITLKVHYSYEPAFPGSIRNGEQLSEPEPAGVVINDITIKLSEAVTAALSEEIYNYLTNL